MRSRTISKYVEIPYSRRYRLQQPVICAPAAPPGPGVTVNHRQPNPSPPGAASGPYHATNGDYLALTRSRAARGAQAALARPPDGGTTGHRRHPARPTHAAHAARSSAALAGRRCARLAAIGADSGPLLARRLLPRRARQARTATALRRHCDLHERGKRG